MNRRTLIRKSKRLLTSLLLRRRGLSRRVIDRRVRAFLRRREREFLLRLLRDQALAVAIAGLISVVPAAQAEVPVEIADVIQGTGGFVMRGIAELDQSGGSVSGAGDVNGDGLEDLVIGAFAADPNGVNVAGEIYVVFGKSDGTAIDLVEVVAGTGGFAIQGVDESDSAGQIVSGAGDVNGDGLGDIILGAFLADPGNRTEAGESYVVFGKADTATVSLGDIAAGTGGFVINGIDAYDQSGSRVAGAGDVNGDGKDDVIVTAQFADPPAGADAGECYVVFGKDTTTAVNLSSVAAGTGGFIINGANAYDRAGQWVSGGGDVNGDGKDDVVIGAFRAAPGGRTDAGATYVVFGKDTGSAINLSSVASGIGGFVINGVAEGDESGHRLDIAGDVNGDGLDDIVIGAHDAYGLDQEFRAGEAYLVFGKATGSTVELTAVTAGTGGFVMTGRDANDRLGHGVAGAGDMNGDGLDDIIVVARYGESYGKINSGEGYVIFGKQDTDRVNLNDIESGTGGFLINGNLDRDAAGSAVSAAGDVNGDGLDDLILGASGADPYGLSFAGESYVVFSPAPAPVVIGLTDAETGDPIPTGRVFLERTDAALGFDTSLAGVNLENGAVFESAAADIEDYVLRAVGSGYLPTDEIAIRSDDSRMPVSGVQLTRDDALSNPNVLRVVIDLLDASESPTGILLLTKSVQVREEGQDLGLVPLFGAGEMIFLGVPVGELEVFIPDTTSLSFAPEVVTLGTGVEKTVTVLATVVDPNPASPALRAAGDLPGIIDGAVGNSNVFPNTPVAEALIVSTQTGPGISTFTHAGQSGDYLFPDIVAGAGNVRAFSANGNILGSVKTVEVVSGEVFGDDPEEDTYLTVPLPASDSDGDGLPDAFEDAFFPGVVPSNQRGPDDDPDGEGLTNLAEYIAETNPTTVDTDLDGFDDGQELLLGADPTDNASTPAAPSEVYVDFGYAGGVEAGTLSAPLTTLQAAADLVTAGGTIWIKGDVDVTTGAAAGSVLGKSVVLRALRGTVTVQ